MSNEKLDRASDVEFAQAIADAIPGPGKDRHTLAKMGAAYILGKAIKSGKKSSK